MAFLTNNLLGYFHFSGKLRRFFLSRLFSWKVSAAFLLGYFQKKSRLFLNKKRFFFSESICRLVWPGLFSNKKRFFFRKPSAAWPGLGYFQTRFFSRKTSAAQSGLGYFQTKKVIFIGNLCRFSSLVIFNQFSNTFSENIYCFQWLDILNYLYTYTYKYTHVYIYIFIYI